MIVSLLLYLLSFVLSIFSSLRFFIAQGWSIWPSNVLDGLTYFLTQLMNWDFLLNITELLTALKWLLGFIIIFLGVKLALKIANWIRGASGIELNN